MKSPRSLNLVAALVLTLLASVTAHAGPAGDALTRCVDTSLTKADRSMLARWMFAAMSAYPDAQKLAAVPGAQMDALNRSVAALFKKLIGQTCNEKAGQAMQSEGKGAVEDAFKLLPQVGVRELVNDPGVARQLQGLQKYMDEGK